MVEEVGTVYFILIIMLFLCVLFDGFCYLRVFAAKTEDSWEYCRYGIKKLKLVLYCFFGIIMLFIGFAAELSGYVRAVHYIIGILLIADAVSGFILKSKFGRKK